MKNILVVITTASLLAIGSGVQGKQGSALGEQKSGGITEDLKLEQEPLYAHDLPLGDKRFRILDKEEIAAGRVGRQRQFDRGK